MSDVASDRAVTNSTCLVGLERIGQLDILPQVQLYSHQLRFKPRWELRRAG